MAWFTSWWAHKDAEDSAGSSYLHANYKHYRQLIRQGPTTMANESPEDLEWGNTTSRVLTHPVLWRWEVFFIFFFCLMKTGKFMYIYHSFKSCLFPQIYLLLFLMYPPISIYPFYFYFFIFFFLFASHLAALLEQQGQTRAAGNVLIWVTATQNLQPCNFGINSSLLILPLHSIPWLMGLDGVQWYWGYGCCVFGFHALLSGAKFTCGVQPFWIGVSPWGF